MVCFHGLYPALRAAPDRACRNDFRRCDLRDYSAQAAEDWRAGTHLGTSDQVRHGLCLSCGRGMGTRCQKARGCRKGARFTCLTRAAAVRESRGIAHWPTETLEKTNSLKRHSASRSRAAFRQRHLRSLRHCFMQDWCEKCGLGTTPDVIASLLHCICPLLALG